MNTAEEVMQFVTTAMFTDLIGEITLNQDGELHLYICDQNEWAHLNGETNIAPKPIIVRLGNTHDSSILARLGAEVHRNQVSTSNFRLSDEQ